MGLLESAMKGKIIEFSFTETRAWAPLIIDSSLSSKLAALVAFAMQFSAIKWGKVIFYLFSLRNSVYEWTDLKKPPFKSSPVNCVIGKASENK